MGRDVEGNASIAVHDYELSAGFPSTSIAGLMDQTLGEAKLHGSQVTMRFLN